MKIKMIYHQFYHFKMMEKQIRVGRNNWRKSEIKFLKKEKNTGADLKNINPIKLLTRIPISLAQIKAGNNSYKLKNEIRQILYLLYQHNKITKKLYNNCIKSLQ